jgi:hypothetical protein
MAHLPAVVGEVRTVGALDALDALDTPRRCLRRVLVPLPDVSRCKCLTLRASISSRRIAWTPEAKQISDRTGVAGSRSTSIVPETSGNRTHRDPIEERGVPCGESR